MTTNPLYTVTVTPSFDGLTPQYEAMLYRAVPAGVCGPFSDTRTVRTLDEVDALVHGWGFRRVEPFGPVCSNGFAEAQVVAL